MMYWWNIFNQQYENDSYSYIEINDIIYYLLLYTNLILRQTPCLFRSVGASNDLFNKKLF